MGIYQPLENYLKEQAFAEVPMTFGDIATVLGRALPKSAFHYRPWWANEAAGHSHAKAWLNAGFETAQVDMAGQKLVFRRVAHPANRGLAEPARAFATGTAPRRSPLFGALKGTFSIEPGVDLTRPAFDAGEWEAIVDAKIAKFDQAAGKGGGDK